MDRPNANCTSQIAGRSKQGPGAISIALTTQTMCWHGSRARKATRPVIHALLTAKAQSADKLPNDLSIVLRSWMPLQVLLWQWQTT
jgi:hypothetical protein